MPWLPVAIAAAAVKDATAGALSGTAGYSGLRRKEKRLSEDLVERTEEFGAYFKGAAKNISKILLRI